MIQIKILWINIEDRKREHKRGHVKGERKRGLTDWYLQLS